MARLLEEVVTRGGEVMIQTFVDTVDDKGRITKIKDGSWGPIGGHSVCNHCAKDMPRCWDIVCTGCRRTFCHDHSRAIGGCWFCVDCAEGNPKKTLVMLANKRLEMLGP
jgi:hypothetical protein